MISSAAAYETAASPVQAKAAVRLENVAKSYKLYDRPFYFLKEALTGRHYHRDKHVLSDISIDIAPGEIVGIIGRNGAGKSTLLKIVAGTLAPTHGSVTVNGRVSAILELGTGFNPNYSGRDNVVLSALMRGMSEAAIRRKFDSVVAFAGLEDVIDEPFHTYSSGMQARLAFAAAVAVEADILIIDEALAAGDIRFASRSLGRIHEICQSGVTALFVSHTSYHVMQLCTRAIWIDAGRIRMDGKPIEVVRAYEYEMHEAIARDQGRMVDQVAQAKPHPNNWTSTSPVSDELQDPKSAARSGAVFTLSAGSSTDQAAEAKRQPNDCTSSSPVSDELQDPKSAAQSGAVFTSAGSSADQSAEAKRQPNDCTSSSPVSDELQDPNSAAQSGAVFTLSAGSSADLEPDEHASRIEDEVTTIDRLQNASDLSSAAIKQLQGNGLTSVKAKVHGFSSGQYCIVEIAFLDRDGRRTTTFRFGELLRLRVCYKCLLPELPRYSCGLAVAFNRISDFEAVMYFNTNYAHSDNEATRYFEIPFRKPIGREGMIEAVIDPIQLRAGEYYVSLGILPNQPGMHEFYEYLHCQYTVTVLTNGFDEPAVFYPSVSWSHKLLERE